MVSIVIPNYNKSRFLRKSLDSVLAQTSSDWEAICIDDCSTDDSPEILREYEGRDPRLRIIFLEKNRGGNYARNLGAAESKGEYLIFLDSDDALCPDCVEMRVREFERPENSEYGMLVFKMMQVRDGQPTGRVVNYRDRENALMGFLSHSLPWQTMMPIWRRAEFERIGGFNEKFPRMQDVELFARALLKGLHYGIASRSTPDCLYSVDDNRQVLDNVRYYKTSVYVTNLFTEEMHDLIANYCDEGLGEMEKSKLVGALSETRWCMVRGICDAARLGRIPLKLRDELCEEVIARSEWECSILKFYVKCCHLWLNRVKGFNYVYRRVLRMLGRYDLARN